LRRVALRWIPSLRGITLWRVALRWISGRRITLRWISGRGISLRRIAGRGITLRRVAGRGITGLRWVSGGSRRGSLEWLGALGRDVDDEVDAAALLDAVRGDHVVPLVDDDANRDCTDLDLEGRHPIVARDVLVPHHDLEDGV
jgi:hypothetical protein